MFILDRIDRELHSSSSVILAGKHDSRFVILLRTDAKCGKLEFLSFCDRSWEGFTFVQKKKKDNFSSEKSKTKFPGCICFFKNMEKKIIT